MSEGTGRPPGSPPTSANLRRPTDANPVNGMVINPPRFAELGGLDGPGKTKTTVNNSKFDIGNPLTLSKPNGGRK